MRDFPAPAVVYETPEGVVIRITPHEHETLQSCQAINRNPEFDNHRAANRMGKSQAIVVLDLRPIDRLTAVRRRIEAASEIESDPALAEDYSRITNALRIGIKAAVPEDNMGIQRVPRRGYSYAVCHE